MSLEAYLSGQALGELQNIENSNISSDSDALQIDSQSQVVSKVNPFQLKNEAQSSRISDLLGHNEESYIDRRLGGQFSGHGAIDFGAHNFHVSEDVAMVSDDNGDEGQKEDGDGDIDLEEDDDIDEDDDEENEEDDDDDDDEESDESNEDEDENNTNRCNDLVNEVKPMINNSADQIFPDSTRIGPFIDNTETVGNDMSQPVSNTIIDKKSMEKARIMANVDSVLDAVAKNENVSSNGSLDDPKPEGETPKAKPKRTRKRKKDQDEKKEKKKKKVKPSNLRKNIRYGYSY